jgi:preprotein translocase SecE subunit
MARDRRRAKQRRDRQARAGGGQPRRVEGPAAPAPTPDAERTHEPADPPELTSGEIDIADAQLAVGRPELVDDPGTPVPPADQIDAAGSADVDDEAAFEALEDRVDAAEEAFEEGAPAGGRADDHADEGGAVATRTRRRSAGGRAGTTAEPREGGRLMTFLRGSWRELQRVQWPDRRQVGQATAVTIGFVIVAGAFLGLADFVAGKVVDFII